MAKSKAKKTVKKDSVTLTRNGFIALTLFVTAVAMLASYAFLNYSAVK